MNKSFKHWHRQSIAMVIDIPMFECRGLNDFFKHWHVVQASAAKVWKPMVAKVSLFQVAEVPTNMYDYTLPSRCSERNSEMIYSLPLITHPISPNLSRGYPKIIMLVS